MNEKFRWIPEYFSKVIKGLLGTQIIAIPGPTLLPRYPEDQEKPVLRYKQHGRVYRSLVIDLSQTGEGLCNNGSETVDVVQLLKEMQGLTRYPQSGSVRSKRIYPR